MKYNKGITDLKKKNKNIHLLVNENKSIEELIHNHSFKKFLYKCAFWKYDNSDLKEEHIQKARSIILGSDEIEPSKNNKDIEYEIKLDW